MFNSLKKYLAAPCLLIVSLSTQAANLELSLAEPSWSFLIDNQVLQTIELTSEERTFLREIQPLLKAADYEAAERAFDNWESEQSEKETISASMALMRGQIYLANNKDKKAIEYLAKAVKSRPDFAPSQRSLGLAYLRSDQGDQARPHLQRAIELGDQSAQLYGQLAYLNLQSGYAASAVAGYQQALFLDADNEEWSKGLLYALTRAQALPQAQAMVEQMLEKRSDDPELWLLRSQIALQQDNPVVALSSLESALSLGNNKPANMITAAQLHLTSGSPERAVELMTSDQNISKGVTDAHENTLVQAAAWLAQQQQWKTLQTLLSRTEKAKLSAPAKAQLAVSRARMAMFRNDFAGAEKSLKHAIGQDPTQGEAIMTLADLLRGQKRYQQAIMYYQRAEPLPGLEERALLGQAQAEIEQSNYDSALKILGEVVRNNPDRTDLRASMHSLRNLVRNRP
ncbi:MAG: hypothetical protein CSH36_02225 [Thalassolituus sp.]|jgi:tetratricopeptide (TPR) repeat protein|nr:MAG: hypothetical protein CSH36_02225 [Thalassolituus sp.]